MLVALFSFPFFITATSSPSGATLINRLQHEHPDGLLSTAKQQYQGLGRRILQTATASGGGGATLTEANTRPISIKLDFSSLDEATAPQYAACFTAGAWFRRGFPSPQTPPEDGVATCVRGTPSETSLAGQDCWGKCLAADVITPEKKALLVAVITKIVTEDLTPLLRVQPVQGPLLFDDNEGVHQRALLSKGYTPYRACAVDCTVLSGVAVDPSYCTEGIPATDAVLSVTMPPAKYGVAGTGSSCVADQNRRPLWLVFEWMRATDDLLGEDSMGNTLSLDEQVERVRGLALHEVLHTLGFSNTAFRYARDGAGARKMLLNLRLVTDSDGSTDEVWHFTKGRAYELAQAYFDCTGGNTSWLGLPLMGAPEMGR